MAERRHPPVLGVPEPPTIPPNENPNSLLGQLVRWARDMTAVQARVNRHQTAAYDSLPAPHQETHLVGGSDEFDEPGTPTTVKSDAATASIGDGPSYMREDAQLVVQTATPTVAVGASFAQGSSQSVMRADAQLKLGIGTTTGDIIEFTGSTPGRRAASTKGTVVFSAGAGLAREDWLPFQYWNDKTLTDNTIATVFTINVPEFQSVNQTWRYQVNAVDASNNIQWESGELLITGRHPASADPSVSITHTVLASHSDSGTLTVTITATTTGDNVAIRVTADTSLTPTSLYWSGCGVAKCDDTTTTYA